MLLRRHYGITASEYLRDLPAWEAQMLVEPFLAGDGEQPPPSIMDVPDDHDAFGTPPPRVRLDG